jgi:hypothetical protein
VSSTSSPLTLDPATGYLPRGRHRVTEQEIRARFVDDPEFATSSMRSDIWDEYEVGRDLLRRHVRVHAIWLGGSFLTSKVDAKDVDAMFIINARDYGKLDVAGKKVVDSFRPQLGPLGKIVRGHGLNLLDSFLLPWFPWSPLDPDNDPGHAGYAARRGYWDDFWQRDRHNKPHGIPPHWKDALPVRGYLEVELDDFTR